MSLVGSGWRPPSCVLSSPSALLSPVFHLVDPQLRIPCTPTPQIAAAQEDIERLAAARAAAQSEAAEAEAAAQQALEAGHGEVTKLRRRWDEVGAQVAGLVRERDAVAGQIEEDRAEWARLRQLEADALAAREAKLAEDRSRLTAELDELLARQEGRLRGWEARCGEQDAALEGRRAELDAEEQRCVGGAVWIEGGFGGE